MTTREVQSQREAVDAVVRAVAQLPSGEFTAYPGGWPDEIGTALVDAVFSIRARYASSVEPRLRILREEHPRARNDLAALAAVSESELRRVMGNTKTAQRYKAACVMEAAYALLSVEAPICTAEDARTAGAETVQRAYRSVKGLGWVTAEYFCMLLGIPGVKADRMVQRFVNAALAAAAQGPVHDACDARALVIAAYEVDSRGADLTHYEHALWRTKGVVQAQT